MKRGIPGILYFVFFVAAVILIGYKIYLHSHNRNEEAETAKWIAFGLVLAALLCRLIPKSLSKRFGNKPTRGEIEKRIHGE